MLKQLAMEITGLGCLPCSDVFLSAESLWQNWLEFANMFELPWNIIYGSTWYFPKYDKMMTTRVMITAVIVQVTLLAFSYSFLFITFLLLSISLSTCSILYYVYFPVYFASSFSLPYVTVPSWLYTSSGAQPQWLLLTLSGPNPSQRYSGFPQVWRQSSYINTELCNCGKAEPLSVLCHDTFFFS